MEEKDKKVEETVKELKRSEKSEKPVNYKQKKNIWKIIGNVVFWTVFALFLICAITSYINFNRVEDNKEPKYYHIKDTYNEDDKDVTVYNYYVYKIVKINDSEGVKVSLKLWFIDDIKKD